MDKIEVLLNEVEKLILLEKDGFDPKIILKFEKILARIKFNNCNTYSDGKTKSFLNQNNI